MPGHPVRRYLAAAARWALLRKRPIDAIANALFGAWELASKWGMAGPDSDLARRFAQFGDGSALMWPPGRSWGLEHVAVGTETLLCPGMTIAVGMIPDEPGLSFGGEMAVTIGNQCSLGRNCTIVARDRVEIGDSVATGPDVYITDHNHRFDDPDTPIRNQWVTSDRVRIGAGAWLGAGVVVLPGANIGCNAVIAAGSVVRGTIPDYAVAAGVPAKIIREGADIIAAAEEATRAPDAPGSASSPNVSADEDLPRWYTDANPNRPRRQ